MISIIIKLFLPNLLKNSTVGYFLIKFSIRKGNKHKYYRLIIKNKVYTKSVACTDDRKKIAWLSN